MPGIPDYTKLHVVVQRATLPTTRPHYHPHVELSYTLAGTGMQTLDGVAYPFGPGFAALSLPHHVHSKTPGSDPGEQIVCAFDMSVLRDTRLPPAWYRQLCQVGGRYPAGIQLSASDGRRFAATLIDLHEEFVTPHRVGRDVIVRAKVVEALLLFLRHCLDGREPLARPTRRGEHELFWSILQHVHRNYVGALQLESVAKQFHVSGSYVTRMFKEHMGHGFLQHVHQLRIASAAGMLTSTDARVADVAIASGFDSPRTFTRVFRELTGQAPSEYREERRSLGSDLASARVSLTHARNSKVDSVER